MRSYSCIISPVNEEAHKRTWQTLERNDPTIAQQITLILNKDGTKEKWQRFYDEVKGAFNKSRADFKYVLRLLRKGYHPQAVAYALYEISPELALRKQKHVQDYIQRTIDKALKYIAN